MARKRKGDEGGGESWLNTYADMVTLLLTFFVMLFSMSSIQEEKWEKLLMAFTNRGNETQQVVLVPEGEGDQMGTNHGEAPPPGDKDSVQTEQALPENFDQLYEYLKAYVERNGMQGSVDIQKSHGSVYIRFKDNIFFDPDNFVLKKDGTAILDFLGDCLKNVEHQIMTINISGHTASVDYENYPVSDWRLSSERASSVAIFFADQKQLDPKKIIPIGYGKNYPVDTNSTPEGRGKNRRVDMLIVSNESDLSNQDLLDSFLTGTFDPGRYPEIGSGKDILLPESSDADEDIEILAEEDPEIAEPVDSADSGQGGQGPKPPSLIDGSSE